MRVHMETKNSWITICGFPLLYSVHLRSYFKLWLVLLVFSTSLLLPLKRGRDQLESIWLIVAQVSIILRPFKKKILLIKTIINTILIYVICLAFWNFVTLCVWGDLFNRNLSDTLPIQETILKKWIPTSTTLGYSYWYVRIASVIINKRTSVINNMFWF